MMTDFDATGHSRELSEYLEVPFRYPIHTFLPFAFVLSMAILLLLALPKKYASSTLIMVESERVSAAMDSDRMYQRLGTIQQEVQSRTRLESVIAELQPYADYNDVSLYWQVEQMRRATHIRVQGNDAFSIEFVHTDPEMAMKVTNRLASLFIENTGRLRKAAVSEARGFTESSLSESRKMLDQADLALRRFKDKYMGALPAQLEANLSTLSRLQLERQTVEASIQAAESRREFALNALANRGQSDATTPEEQELERLRGEIAGLRDRYTEQHPDVRRVAARIEMLERSIAAAKSRDSEEAGRVAESRNSEDIDGPLAPLSGVDFDDPATMALNSTVIDTVRELESLHRQREQLLRNIQRFQERVELTPRIESELYTLERDYELRRQNYDLMLQRNLNAEMNQRLEAHLGGELFRILDPAHVPERAVSPNAFLFVLAGLFFGALAGIGTSLVADFFDDTVKTVKHLETFIPAPVIATVPYVSRIPIRMRVRA